MEFISKSTLKEKVAQKLGLDQPSVLDTLSRSNFASDDAYLDAATKAELERNSPEYQAARRKVEAEYRERQEAAERKLQAEQRREIRAKVKLYDFDIRQIDSEATELAQRDLAAGRIRASELGAAIAKHAEKLTEKKKDQLAMNAEMNALLRAAVKQNSAI